jgi:hypothetical protein
MPSPTLLLRIGLFFDGTGNNLANADVHHSSHIARLFKLYPNAPHFDCLSLYIEGIGTRDGQPDAAIAMATGAGELGWEARVAQAQEQLAKRLEGWLEGRAHAGAINVEVDLFGFSRGAACARHFANDLHAGEKGALCTLLRNNATIRAALPDLENALQVRFMGLFDTVASIISLGTSPRLQLPEGVARRIVHLVARDELRCNFPLSSAGRHDLPLPGAHADIGGGYPPETEERLLLTRPDRSLSPGHLPLSKAASYGRALALLRQCQAQRSSWGFDYRTRAWAHKAPARDPRSAEAHVYAAVEGRRVIRNDLAQVALEIMHRLACAEGVPLGELPPGRYRPELQPVVDKLQAYASRWAHDGSADMGLSSAEEALLAERYIHHSSHWGCDDATPTSDLEGLYVHRPEPKGKRRILCT